MVELPTERSWDAVHSRADEAHARAQVVATIATQLAVRAWIRCGEPDSAIGKRKKSWQNDMVMEIRPHRFGGEGVLIGGQSATLHAQ